MFKEATIVKKTPNKSNFMYKVRERSRRWIRFYMKIMFCYRSTVGQTLSELNTPPPSKKVLKSELYLFLLLLLNTHVKSLVPNSVTTIFGFSLIGRRETIRKTERQRKDASNLFNRLMIYKGQTCAFII